MRARRSTVLISQNVTATPPYVVTFSLSVNKFSYRLHCKLNASCIPLYNHRLFCFLIAFQVRALEFHVFYKRYCRENLWTCAIYGTTISQCNGHTNYWNHVLSVHENKIAEYLEARKERSRKAFSSIIFEPWTAAVHTWVECIALGLLPFCFVKNKTLHRHFKRESCSPKSLFSICTG